MVKETTEVINQFPFGKNWQSFLNVLTDDHIHEAKKALIEFLGTSDLTNKRFLDIGSGSGIHSLAAREMGAQVYSFDIDLQSVECTEELKRRYFFNDPQWSIERGSILDRDYVENLGKYDISYSWGVLHHTNTLWQALYNAQIPLDTGGLLFIAIYNDQGLISSLWTIVKHTYCSGWLGRSLITGLFYPIFLISGLFLDLVHLRNPLERYRNHKKYRGMSLFHDWRDWLGGYPFEPAKPERIIRFYQNLGYELIQYKPTDHGFGNNQFLFRKTNNPDSIQE